MANSNDDKPERILVQIELTAPPNLTKEGVVYQLMELIPEDVAEGRVKLLWWRLAEGGQG